MAKKTINASKVPLSLRQVERRTSGRTASGLMSVSLLALAGAGGSALAQQDQPDEKTTAVELKTIVVEGASEKPDANLYADPQAPYKVDVSASPKRTEPLLDTPTSITALPKEVIEDAGATSLKDVMRTQPGVTLGTGEGGNAFGDRFIIRGFEARNDVFVDGLRDPGVTSRETFAVEQVEISKGPSSTFAGRGTTGGAVNSITKMPGIEDFGELGAGISTDGTQRLTLDLNRVLSEKLALRFNGLVHNGEVAGRDEVFDDRRGAALAVQYLPSDAVILNFDYYHLETEGLPDWGVPWDYVNDVPFGYDRSNFYGLVNRDFWETSADIVTGKAEIFLNDQLRLSSQLRYGVTTNAYVASAPESPNFVNGTVQAIAKSRDQENEYLGHQTNLIAEFDQGRVEHTVVVGFEVSREEISNRPFLVTPRAVTQDLYDPDPFNWSGSVVPGNSEARFEVDTAAVYALDTVELSERWQVFGGLRLDSYQISAETIVNDYAGEPARLENDAQFLNWHAGVVYKPVPRGSIYASAATSSNPSGEQLDAGGGDYGGLTAENQDLEPERNRSYELGTKWSLFGEDLLLTAAVFQIDKVNARTIGAGGVTTLDGEQRVRGLEFGVAGNITPRWSVSGGIALLDTEILNAADPDAIGRPLPNVAETTFNLQSRYQLTEAFAFGGQVYYSSEIYGGAVVAGDNSIPSYTRLDLMGEYRLTQDLTARLNVLNATDEVYYDALYRSRTPFVYVAPGRSATLSLIYGF